MRIIPSSTRSHHDRGSVALAPLLAGLTVPLALAGGLTLIYLSGLLGLVLMCAVPLLLLAIVAGPHLVFHPRPRGEKWPAAEQAESAHEVEVEVDSAEPVTGLNDAGSASVVLVVLAAPLALLLVWALNAAAPVLAVVLGGGR